MSEIDKHDLENLLEFIKRNRGFDFTGYKRGSLVRRIRRRMQDVGVDSFDRYRDLLEVDPDEFTHLFNTILINVTSFFRDREAWEYVASEIIPQIVDNHGPGGAIRMWSAGCASGQEPYSLAMLMAERMGAEAYGEAIKIYATDVDEEALEQARAAVYTREELKDVPVELRAKYFDEEHNRYVLAKDLRRMVIFGRHDLLQDAPISRLDLLVCRNTLIYFNSEAQRRILARFHFALRNSGYLFLGRSEMMFTQSFLFEPLETGHRIFTTVPGLRRSDRLAVLGEATGLGADEEEPGLRIRLQQAAFDKSPVAYVVLDEERRDSSFRHQHLFRGCDAVSRVAG